MTVTRLARSCKLSRSTVLYYESIGLLQRPNRTSGNYRSYGTRDLDRLRQICLYRDAGLTLADIRTLLGARTNDASAVLRRRLAEIGGWCQPRPGVDVVEWADPETGTLLRVDVAVTAE